MKVNYMKNVINFEREMIKQEKDMLEFAMGQYQKLQALKAPKDLLEKWALLVKRCEDKIYKLQQNMKEEV